MTEKIIVDFSRVEDALRQSAREREVVTDRERTKNSARLIKYSAAGCALVIVSIGLAFWLGRQWQMAQSSGSHPSLVHDLLGQVKAEPRVAENKVVTDVNLFRSIKREDLQGFFNPHFGGLVAGHLYTTSNSTRWDKAWCYANFMKNDLLYRVDLVVRQQNDFVPRIVSATELRELGLTSSEVTFLRNRCPWRE